MLRQQVDYKVRPTDSAKLTCMHWRILQNEIGIPRTHPRPDISPFPKTARDKMTRD